MKEQLLQIQAKLDSFKYPIRFKEEIKINDLAEVFIQSVKGKHDYKYDNSTWYVGINRRQCKQGASRSFTDIYRIAKFYFPNITYEDVYMAAQLLTGKIKSAKDNKYKTSLDSFFCPDVQKIIICARWVDEKTIRERLEQNNLNYK